MKLSEAIREGTKFRSQGFGNFIKHGGSCALGAGMEGFRGKRLELNSWQFNDAYMDFFGIYDGVLFRVALTPCSQPCNVGRYNSPRTVKAIIEHLNDDHRWTREAIADWVEKIEAEAA